MSQLNQRHKAGADGSGYLSGSNNESIMESYLAYVKPTLLYNKQHNVMQRKHPAVVVVVFANFRARKGLRT